MLHSLGVQHESSSHKGLGKGRRVPDSLDMTCEPALGGVYNLSMKVQVPKYKVSNLTP